MINYKKLFEIEILHGYYKDNICRDLKIVPNSATQNWMGQTGAIWKNQLNKWYFIIPENLDLNILLNENPDFSFKFNGQSTDSNFISFTDFPIDKLGYLEFSNLDLDESNEQLILYPNFLDSDNSNVVAQIDIDLSVLNEEDGLPMYQIIFKERRLPWRYYLINQTGNGFNPIRLGGSGGSLFSGPVEEEIPTGIKAQVFDSGENKLALKEYNDMEITLSGGENNKVLIERMPVASPSSLQVKGQDLYAALYIYL